MVRESQTTFEQAEAYRRKQNAYESVNECAAEYQELKTKVEAARSEVDKLQADFETAANGCDLAYKEYNEEKASYEAKIGDLISVISETSDLEERFHSLASSSASEPMAELYNNVADFLLKERARYREAQQRLLEEKRNLSRPDTKIRNAILEALKTARNNLSKLSEEYRAVREELVERRELFRLAREDYDRIRDKIGYVSGQEENNLNRPTILKAANVPTEFWDDSKIRQRSDGRIDIYYGGSDCAHGHVVLNGDNVEYVRSPKKSVI